MTEDASNAKHKFKSQKLLDKGSQKKGTVTTFKALYNKLEFLEITEEKSVDIITTDLQSTNKVKKQKNSKLYGESSNDNKNTQKKSAVIEIQGKASVELNTGKKTALERINDTKKKVVYSSKKKNKSVEIKSEVSIAASVACPELSTEEKKVSTKTVQATVENVVSDWEALDWEASDYDSSNPDSSTVDSPDKAPEKGPSQPEAPPQAAAEATLRSPICCVLGHVDTGKTKLLDNIRSTNVQDGEAGGITQQIGATFVPTSALAQRTAVINRQGRLELKVPGLLVIDTPGHESFSNLRLRGSSLCDIAILVVDIQHGLEQQTIESISILKKRKTPFVVAINKIDVCYGWTPRLHSGFRASFKNQKGHAQKHFNELASKIVLQLAEQGFNAALYYENKDLKKTVSLVPTSAKTGEGIPDLLGLIVQLTQRWMATRISFKTNVECTILEVKKVQGLGTTVDVILSQGSLKQGQTIVLCGLDGPIRTTIRELLMPQPLRELRVKSNYVSHKVVSAAQGVKIFAKHLESAVAGTPLYVIDDNTDESRIKEIEEKVINELKASLDRFETQEEGVCAQASTLGALEALLVFFETSKIPVSSVDIGPVHKKQVVKCSTQKDALYSCILAFDVPVDPEAKKLAKQKKITIFTADIIYHLFDRYMEFRKTELEKRKRAVAHLAWFPCVLQILPESIFRNRDPLIMGVTVVEGTLRSGVPIVVPDKDFLELGVVDSIQINNKDLPTAKTGQSVCVRIQNTRDAPRMYGRHFDHTNLLYTNLSRRAIDVLKEHYKEEMTKNDWKLIVKMKKIFKIL
ncbi:hypothetical protein Zmor_012322 [Zophobas morio]|uniref:Eukaryotic translation initiation factor 5B n=2 Tax=Zophobas morio TaxID=2755281 RepID=A0AA38HGA1_9CUCU|nr:hypothetical protein Zmor_012322 [Zophobas morio]